MSDRLFPCPVCGEDVFAGKGTCHYISPRQMNLLIRKHAAGPVKARDLGGCFSGNPEPSDMTNLVGDAVDWVTRAEEGEDDD